MEQKTNEVEISRTVRGISLITNGAFAAQLEGFRDGLLSIPGTVEDKARALGSTGDGLAALEFCSAVANLSGKFSVASSSLLSTISATQKRKIGILEDEAPKEGRLLVRPPTPIRMEKMLVVLKASRLERDMKTFGVSREQMVQNYQSANDNVEKIIWSHDRQKAAIEKMRRFLPQATFMNWPEVTKDTVKSFELVIALGGDNHFHNVSHLLGSITPVVGVNSDSASDGATLMCSAAKFESWVGRLVSGNYHFQAWTRLKATIDGIEAPKAIDAYFIGEDRSKYMSRNTFEAESACGERSEQREQKSSGLIVATGCGSSGWCGAAARYLFPGGFQFPRTARYARYILREPHSSMFKGVGNGDRDIMQPENFRLATGYLTEGQKLIIHSTNDDNGIITPDSFEDIPLGRGKTAIIEVDPDPLWVPCVEVS